MINVIHEEGGYKIPAILDFLHGVALIVSGNCKFQCEWVAGARWWSKRKALRCIRPS